MSQYDADIELLVPSLNEEQKALLEALEEEFKNRYTEEDENFKAALLRKLPPPPIHENWFKFHDRSRRENFRGDYRRSYPEKRNDYECYRGYRREDDDDYNYNRRRRSAHLYHPY